MLIEGEVFSSYNSSSIDTGSFRTERYLGKDRNVIRRTRVLATGQIDWLPPIMLADTHSLVNEVAHAAAVDSSKEPTLTVECTVEAIKVQYNGGGVWMAKERADFG